MATIISIPILDSIGTNSVRPLKTYRDKVKCNLHIMTHLITVVVEKKVIVDDVLSEKVSIVYKNYDAPSDNKYYLTEVITNLNISEVLSLINS